MKVGILGSGDVGKALGAGFLKQNHDVMLGTRDAKKLADWKKANPMANIGTVEQTAKFGELIVLAVRGDVSAEGLIAAGKANLTGKIVIDATNPVADAPPDNGVLKLFTDNNESLLEKLQKDFPDAKLVKAFNSVGADLMVNPKLKGGPPTMFICGNDPAAKKSVAKIVESFGWEVADMGPALAARAIEPLCMLWCIPGFINNDWVHAFKVIRP